MRNIDEYPITKAEIVDILQEVYNEIYNEGLCGDVRPIALKIAMTMVEESQQDPMLLLRREDATANI
jgi:hypothetical protein